MTAALGAIVLSAAVLSACSSAGDSRAAPSPSPHGLATVPLATSFAGQTGTWATLAMGHLDEPLNTFWQLLYLSDSSSAWEMATPPGVASNGGLVVSFGPSATVTAGFEPSLDLRFSPLAQSTDQGSTWEPGVLPGGLASVPDSLAASAGHQYLALLRTGGGDVVTNNGDLAEWKRVASTATLIADPSASACDVEALTAVSFAPNGEELVGAACARGPEVGIFESVDGAWQPIGPSVPAPEGPTQVLRLVATAAGTTALVSAGEGRARRLVALWSSDGVKSWSVSASLPLGRGSLTSTGVTATGGLIVTVRGADGSASASAISPSGGPWRPLAPLPAGTSVVVGAPDGVFDALIADQSSLDVDTLGSGGWHRTQTLNVPIQYGSSG